MASYSAGSASVQIVPDFSGAQRAIGKWFASQGDMKINVQPDLDNGDLARMRAQVARQHPDMKVGIDRKHLAKELVTAVDFITGTSAVGGALRKLFDVKPILLANLGGAATAVGSAIGQSLTTAVGGAAAMLPSLLSAAAIPIGTAILGSQGIGDAFKNIGDPTKLAEALKKLAPAARDFVTEIHSLAPAFKDLRLDVQEHLFAGLGDTIRDLGEKMLPMLRGHLTGIADEINFMGQSLAKALSSDSNVADFAHTIDNVKLTLHGMAEAIAPIWQSFADLATVGSDFLPGLVKGFGDLAQRFADFIRSARESGALHEFIANSMNGLKQLLAVIGNLGSVLTSVFRVALPYGQVLVGVLKALTGDLAAFAKTDVASSGLEAFFSGLTDAIATLAPGLETLVEAMVTSVLPAMAAFASAVAPVVNSLLTQFAGLLGDLAPLFYPALADAVGSALSALAPLVTVFSEIARAILPAVTEAIKRLSPLFTELAEGIGEALAEAVKALEPLLPPLVDAIVAIAEALVPFILSATHLAVSVLPPLVLVLQGVAKALQFIAPILPTVLTGFLAFKAVAGISTILTGFSGVLTGLAQKLAFASYSNIPEFGAAAGRASTLVSRFANGVSVVSKALGPLAVGLAIAIPFLQLVQSTGDRAAKSFQDMVKAMVDMKLKNSIGDPEAAKQLTEYQKQIEGVRSKIEAYKKEISAPGTTDSVIQYDQEQILILEQNLEDLLQGSKDADDGLKAMREELGTLGFAQAQAAAALEVYNRAVDDSGENSPAAIAAAGELATAQQRVAEITERSNTATKTKLQLMKEEQDAILAAASAEIAFQRSQLDSKDAIDQYNASVADGTVKVNDGSRAELDLRDSLLSAAEAAARKAEADNAGKTPAEIARASAKAYYDQLVTLAQQLGENCPQAIKNLIDSLGDSSSEAAITKGSMQDLGLTVIGIPNDKTITIKAPTAEQEAALSALGYHVTHMKDGTVQVIADTQPAKDALAALTAEKHYITLQARIANNGSLLGGFRAGLGEIGGIVKPMANGGVNSLFMSGRVASVVKPNTWRIIGDRVTDDEAFIPINGSSRSTAILGETAGAMGYSLVPNARGNYWTPPGMGSISSVGSDSVSLAGMRDAIGRSSGATQTMPVAATSVAGFVNHGTVLTTDLDGLARKARRGTQRALAVAGL